MVLKKGRDKSSLWKVWRSRNDAKTKGLFLRLLSILRYSSPHAQCADLRMGNTEQSWPFFDSTAPCWSLDGLSCSLSSEVGPGAVPAHRKCLCVVYPSQRTFQRWTDGSTDGPGQHHCVRANLDDLSSTLLLKTVTLSLSECVPPTPTSSSQSAFHIRLALMPEREWKTMWWRVVNN